MIHDDGLLEVRYQLGDKEVCASKGRARDDAIGCMARYADRLLRRARRAIVYPTLRWRPDRRSEDIDGMELRFTANTVRQD